jgi:hypothetical protein
LTTNKKAVLKGKESQRQKRLIEEKEQRENKRRKVTCGYSTAK